MEISLKEKVAIVTGASSGIGAATAIKMAEAGAKVVLAARRDNESQAVPYDPVLAEQILDDAGYPRDHNGVRFGLPFFIRVGRGDEAIGMAVVDDWRSVGIDVNEWMAEYQTYRPRLITRTATEPWIHSAGAENPQAPWDWPVMGLSECSISRGGINIGIEVRELCEFYDAMNAEPDKTARVVLRNGINDFLLEWNPAIGTIAIPQVAIANPNKIASWDMPLSVREASIHHPEFIAIQ
jgi:ABC-type transport system substrate-binding protein